MLVPVWLLAYNYRAKAFQVIVNGYTGKIAGKYPISIWKVLLVILLVAIVVLTVISLEN